MIVRTRFAPSPTGRLHLGHVLAARIACSMARHSPDGVFLLRHEDIDGSRVREEFYHDIEGDLKWLGLDWDGVPLRQSARISAYDKALESLHRRTLAYPCFCTRREIQEELSRIAAAPQGAEVPVYPGICRRLSADEQQGKIDVGLPYAWRLDSRRAGELVGELSLRDLRFGRNLSECRFVRRCDFGAERCRHRLSSRGGRG
ncbi:MAG: hypothetical protein HC845_05870 [Akkermansiaceae bacterium]|nr:hypothetical protein [Akkermansiaceae bacterium]